MQFHSKLSTEDHILLMTHALFCRLGFEMSSFNLADLVPPQPPHDEDVESGIGHAEGPHRNNERHSDDTLSDQVGIMSGKTVGNRV